MELVLIKNKGQLKIYQGTLDYHEADYHFFATVVDGTIQDLVVYKLDEKEMVMKPVDEYTKGALFDILVDEYVHSGI
jgi:hypothetical protein